MCEGLSLPKYAYGQDGFSKKRMVSRLLNNKQMRGFSTFQATTVKATSIYSFLSCLLEAVAALGMVSSRMQPSHITTVVSHKEICRAGGRFDPRIEQMAKRAEVSPEVHDGHGSVYSLASYSRIKYPETRQ